VRIATRSLSWALLVLLTAGAAAAQEVIPITGVITTRDDGLPVPGAHVSVQGTEASATTGADGRYTLQAPRSSIRGGRIQLKVDALGQPARVIDVAADGASLTVDIPLTLQFTEHVTVGSRAVGAEAEKAVPVDIITHEQIAATGYVDGVTTNPTLVAKSGKRFIEVVREICDIVEGPVSAEVTATDHKTMLAEGRKLAQIARNIAVSVWGPSITTTITTSSSPAIPERIALMVTEP